MNSTIRKALVLLALIAATGLPLAAQLTDCAFTFSFTGDATQTGVSNLSGQTPCVNWRITFSVTLTLTSTVTFQTSPDNSTWTSVPNTLCSSTVQPPCILQGTNPLTGTTQGMSYFSAYGAYVRVITTGSGGAGTGTVRGYGSKGATASAQFSPVNTTGFVPYTGATAQVDLGANAITAATFGTNALPATSIFLGSAPTNNIQLTGTSAAARVVTIPDIGTNTGATVVLAATSTTTTQALFASATAGQGTYRAIAAGDLPGTLSNGTAITSASLTTPVITTDLHCVSAGGCTLGTNALPASSVFIGNAATNNIQLTGTSAAARVVTIPDIGTNTGATIVLAATSTTTTQALFASATAGLGTYRAIAAGDLPGILSNGTAITNAALTTPVITTDLHCVSAGGCTLGTNALPASSVFIGNAATNNIQLTGTSAAARVVTIPDIGTNTGATLVLAATSTTTTQALFASATAGQGTYRAIAPGDLPTGGAQIAFASASLTLTGSYQDIVGATITLTRAGVYLVQANILTGETGAGDLGVGINGQLVVDGAAQTETVATTLAVLGAFLPASQQWLITASGAGKIIKLQGLKTSGSGTSIIVGNSATTSLSAIWVSP